jgi:cell division transport system ATP-binding protein
MIYFDNVSKLYNDGRSAALQEVTFQVEPQEFVSIVGHSGAGKTTLLKMIIAEDRPSHGSVFFESLDVHKIPKSKLPKYRRKIGTVFQDFKLLANKTAFENVAFAMEANGRTDAEIAENVPQALGLVDLEDKIWNFPHELSGGEKQRVAIARAIVNQPDIIIADEPTGNLDPIATYEVVQILKKINDLGTTVIMTTHNKGVIDELERRVVTMDDGRIVMVALFVIGSTIFVDQLLTTSLNTLQSKVDINVYFVPDAPQEEIDRITTAVSALPDVASVEYTSREEALRLYRERNRNDEIAMQALDELDENPLGANIAIQARETSQYEQVARFLEEQQAQEEPHEINYARNRDSIDTLTAVIEAVEQASFIILIVLLVASVLITFNTIRLAIYTAREEIAIMRLVGASNMFIRGPFMLQGMMYGFIAGLLALAIFYPLLVWIGPSTEAFFELNLLTYYINNFGQIFGVLVGVGVVLGLLSSILAIARHLKT